MELSMSMFASSADYWKCRAELAETTVRETAETLGCEPDNEAMLAAAQNAKRYEWLRNSDWDCFDSRWLGAHDVYGQDPDELDVLIDAKMAEDPAVG